MTNSVKKEKKDFEGMNSEEIFSYYGGELLRGNVSKVIRELSSIGFTRGQISKMLGKRYQHVRNVLTEVAKKN